jgi:hypothetical protein
VDDDECRRRARERDVELAKAPVAGRLLDDECRLDDHDVVELETFGRSRSEHREACAVERRCPLVPSGERLRRDHGEQTVLGRERRRFRERELEDGLSADDASWIGTCAIRDRCLRAGSDAHEERHRDLHDLARYAVGVAELDDVRPSAVREVSQDVVPVPVRDGARRLRDVAEDGEAVSRPATDHAKLHRR